MSEYFIYYTESNLVCCVIFGILLVHDLLNVDRQEKQVKYDKALVSFMLYFLSDSVWAAVDSGVLPKTPLSVAATMLSDYILMGAITYSWLNYAMAVQQVPNRNRPVNRFAVLFPLLASTIALLITYAVNPKLLINDALEAEPLFSVFLVAVPYIYIAASLFYSLTKAHSESDPMEKRKYLYVGLFPLMVIAGGLVEMVLLPTTPVFCFSCTILMLMFYIQSMESLISMDPLTHLNNRGQLLRYVSQDANMRMEGRRTFVIMLDVNYFKEINDTYGHAEGDHALIIIADSLRNVVRLYSMPIFLGRYGGDEFILIAHPNQEESLDELIDSIRSQIKNTCETDKLPYVISVGAGYDQLKDDGDSFHKCMQRADHNLYLDKERIKRQDLRTGRTPSRW